MDEKEADIPLVTELYAAVASERGIVSILVVAAVERGQKDGSCAITRH